LTNPTPRQIKVQVLYQWIQGFSRDKIAENNDIGRGSVTNIIEHFKTTTVPDIDLLRETSLQIKKQDIAIFSLAASLRLRRFLEDRGITEDRIESLLEEIDVFCYKQQITPKDFILKINQASTLARDLQTPIHKLPSIVHQLLNQKGKLEREIAIKKQEYRHVASLHEKYVDELKKFREKRHLLLKLNDLRQLLDHQNRTLDLISQENCDLAKENYYLKAILAKDDILPFEFKETNKKLAFIGDNKPFDKKEISDIVYELYHYPSDHIDIIKTMRQWNEQRQQQQSCD
jgi:hypothetical protein